ncbi:hypothetical protein AU381_17920 [Sinorhizobium glycinis]|uniref:Methyltransferase type 11 n=1 Tax=Sinorhizobium glycinis TaxID=1472378 RepID=A0A178XMB8_9HYPH|nr:DUF1698 domain-containing protein [Sinorhizobium glycinis]OAP36390.1 hypothetical protein AU381_17920 [Sinorhizobium glycinis]
MRVINEEGNTLSARYDRSDDDCRAFLRHELPHYHIVQLNDRVRTPGRVDRNQEFSYIGLKAGELKGRSVLDVGALDGVTAFNAEKAGASAVLAIDVEDPALQDWGWSGPPKSFSGHGEIKNRVFPKLKEFFNSDVERRKMTVYELSPKTDGPFDVIFFYGVLYHLRHPLLAFDKLRAVCNGAICVETHICNYDPLVPSSLFYRDDVLDKADSNWSGPSESCVASWMLDAGFSTIYAEKKPRIQSRQRFIGFVDTPFFEVNKDNFQLLNDAYFSEVRRETESRIRTGRLWRF